MTHFHVLCNILYFLFLRTTYADHLKPVSPAPLWSVNITFHTATLLWRVPAEAALNDTYAVVYWEYDNPNVTLVHDTSVEIGFVESLMKTTIVGLVSGVLYEWSVEARNEITSVQSVTSNFTTVHYGECCRNGNCNDAHIMILYIYLCV
jgi:hypothetical protein